MASSAATRSSARGGGLTLGVDFGTTNTVAAFCLAANNAAPDLVRFGPQSNDVVLRTIAHLKHIRDGSGTLLLGQTAAQAAAIESDSRPVLWTVKDDLGSLDSGRAAFRSKYSDWFPSGLPLDPEDIVAAFLKCLHERAVVQLGEGASRMTRDAVTLVIGIPARASQGYRLAMMNAAAIAGFGDTVLVAEPVAACQSIGHGLTNNHAQRILVVDVGAGTADLSIVEVGPAGSDVVVTAGDPQCGGNRIDWAVLDYLCDRYSSQGIRRSFRNLEEVRRIKEESNRLLDTHAGSIWRLALDGDGATVACSISGGEVHSCASIVAKRIRDLIEDALEQGLEHSGRREPAIGRVVLIGGGIRTRAVLEELQRVIGSSRLSGFFRLTHPFRSDTAAQSVEQGFFSVAKGLAVVGRSHKLQHQAASSYVAPHVVEPVGIGIVNDDSGGYLPRGVLRNSIHLERYMQTRSFRGEWFDYFLDRRDPNAQVDAVTLAVLAGEGEYVRGWRPGSDTPNRFPTARQIGEVRFPLRFPRHSHAVNFRIRYEVDDNGVYAVWIRDMGGDDTEGKRTYQPEPEGKARRFVLDVGVLSSNEVAAKRERLANISTRLEFVVDG